MKRHAQGYITSKSEQGPVVHSGSRPELSTVHTAPMAIGVRLSFVGSFIQSTNSTASPRFSAILGSRKSCKDEQGKISALKQLTISCAVNKKQKATECPLQGQDKQPGTAQLPRLLL